MARFMLVDKLTGEVVEPEVLLIGRKPYRADKGFVKVFVAFLQDVVADEEVAGKAVRLLLWILQKLDYNSLIVVVRAEEVAQELGVHRATIYKWLQTLLEKGYLEKLGANVYRLKPYSAVKGSMQEIAEHEPDF